MEIIHDNLEAISTELHTKVMQLQAHGRTDLILRAIGVPLLEVLQLEAARVRLSQLLITRDYRFILLDNNRKEIELQPVHKAVYLLFLLHPEGIAFKQLSEYKDELYLIYSKIAHNLEAEKIKESIAHLTNPLDNAINEKCSRIKNTFLKIMDEYTASYYIISGHRNRTIANSERIWHQRLKVIMLPRELVVCESVEDGITIKDFLLGK